MRAEPNPEINDDQLAGFYENGATLTQLAAITGQYVAKIRKRLVDAGCVIRPKGGDIWSPERLERRATVRQFREDGKTFKEIAYILGISKQAVQQMVKRDLERCAKSSNGGGNEA